MPDAPSSPYRFNFNIIRRKLPLNRSIIGLLALALTLLLAVNIASYVMIHRTSTSTQVASNSKYIQLDGMELVSLLTDAETGQRGFMLTAEPAYLAVYTNALEELPSVMDRLAERVKGNAVQEARLNRVRELYSERRELMVDTVELTRTGRIGEAVSLVRSGRGKLLMDEMRGEIALLREYEDTRVDMMTRVSQRAQAITLAFNTIGGALVLLLGWISWMMARRHVATLEEAQDALDRANAGLEEEVRDRTADLVQANEEIQRFAYIVSHDLRAPLVNVMGYTSELEEIAGQIDNQLVMLEEKAPDLVDAETARAVREDVPEAINFIRASTAKMDSLIKAILRLSREGRRKLVGETLDMTALVQNLVNAIDQVISQNDGQVEVHDLPNIVSDRMSVEQIFGNLIENAAKYRDQERPLRLVVKGHKVEGDWVEFVVSDNGRGIAPKDHERIFELFRRAGKQDRPGEGLGLAFVRSAVRRLGGNITLDSDLGEGATFRIRFPRQMVVKPELE